MDTVIDLLEGVVGLYFLIAIFLSSALLNESEIFDCILILFRFLFAVDRILDRLWIRVDRNDRLFPFRRISDGHARRLSAASFLAVIAHRVDGEHLDLENLLDRLFDVDFVALRSTTKVYFPFAAASVLFSVI